MAVAILRLIGRNRAGTNLRLGPKMHDMPGCRIHVSAMVMLNLEGVNVIEEI
jgi:hypothetical protein